MEDIANLPTMDAIVLPANKVSSQIKITECVKWLEEAPILMDVLNISLKLNVRSAVLDIFWQLTNNVILFIITGFLLVGKISMLVVLVLMFMLIKLQLLVLKLNPKQNAKTVQYTAPSVIFRTFKVLSPTHFVSITFSLKL